MIEELVALADGKRMGCLLWDRKRDRLSFRYEDGWQADPSAFPLSLSMPLAASEHSHRPAEAFIWGLLPDNERVLQRWGERFHVSPRNPFRMLWHVGEECAGAIQFVQPKRSEDSLRGGTTDNVVWLTEDNIAERMRLLVEDHSAARTGSDAGHFSLAGAQPKTGYHFDPEFGRWGVPEGTVPTTHIFKPATGAFDGYVENEHFCMRLARAVGLPVARSEVRHFGGIPVFVVERYDRVRVTDGVRRVHQEDMCQALACLPHLKYQNQGGPSPQDIIGLIREYSCDRAADEARFWKSLVFHWLIGGTDAHAKNYSLLIGAGGQVRLAPLYDLASSLPYPRQVDPRRASLAMKVGGKYRLREIGAREWKKFSAEMKMDVLSSLEGIRSLAEALPEAAHDIGAEMRRQGLNHPVVQRLIDGIEERATECVAQDWTASAS